MLSLCKAAPDGSLTRLLPLWCLIVGSCTFVVEGEYPYDVASNSLTNGGGAAGRGVCVSDTWWEHDLDEESVLMDPGMDCIACHEGDEGPRLTIAGTVYSAYDEPDLCYGIPDAIVEVTGADGRVFTLPTNGSGNFFMEAGAPLTLPYTVKVVGPSGAENPMITAVSDTNCARCHTAGGVDGAPGRVVAF